MPGDGKSTPPGKVPDAVRRAVERTIESTLGSGAHTRERAQDLVDDVLRRAEQGAVRATRGVREVTDKQREAATGVGERLVAALTDLRLATGEDVRDIRDAIERLERRIAKLEKSATRTPAKKKAKTASTSKSSRGGKTKRAKS